VKVRRAVEMADCVPLRDDKFRGRGRLHTMHRIVDANSGLTDIASRVRVNVWWRRRVQTNSGHEKRR
jgi:hypothetical protein